MSPVRGDRERLRELLDACHGQLEGRDVKHICDGAQRVLSMCRSIEGEIGQSEVHIHYHERVQV